MMSEMLAQCDAFVTTSQSAYDQLVFSFRWVGSRSFSIIPHGRDFSAFARIGHLPAAHQPVKVLVPGNISRAKGGGLLSEIAELDREGRFQFHILGGYDPGLKTHPNIVQHGRYERDQFLDIVREIDPHVGAIFSLWPETFCHTLTEMWACGLPVIGLDLGAVGERIRATGGGWTIAATDAGSIHAAMRGIIDDPADFSAKIAALEAIQADLRTEQSVAKMADRYWALYRELGLWESGHAADLARQGEPPPIVA
jgi:glycosyltransferase involved in cell wall biosynthesis